MRGRSILLILLLYTALAWVVAAYRYSGQEIQEKGLLWTAIGIGAVLGFLLIERLILFWKGWKARRATKPSLPPPAPKQVHEDDAALAAMWKEAALNLAASPVYGVKGRNLSLSQLPLYLIAGATGSGKTSTFLNAGIEPQLLAGQTRGDAPVMTTRVANLWIAHDVLFAEIGGRLFDGDLERWKRFLQGFRSESSQPVWKRVFNEERTLPEVRGVILFEDVSRFSGTTNATAVGQESRNIQDRMQAIADGFGFSIPVYVVFTKTDQILFFEDYFAKFPEAEASQVFGWLTTSEERRVDTKSTVWAETENRRLTKAFNSVNYRLSDRRVLHLLREGDPVRKPGVYEFPREFRRIRGSLVQFLTDAFKPNPLKAGAVLRGFFFTGTRLVEVEAPVAVGTGTGWSATSTGAGVTGLGATQIFRGDATEIFRPEVTIPGKKPAGGTGLRQRWMFAKQLFLEVIPKDRVPSSVAVPSDRKLERYRTIAMAAAAGVAIVFAFIWLQSWFGNRAFLGDVREAAEAAKAVQKTSEGVSVAGLQSLETLRRQVVRLEEDPPMRLRWLLYSGNSVKNEARRLYFQRFQDLLLRDLNAQIVQRLSKLPSKPGVADPFDSVYDGLKTHLTITSAQCIPDPPVVSRVLKTEAEDTGVAGEGMRRQLVNQQIDFFAASLASGIPVHLTEDGGAKMRARSYLSQVKSIERIYAGILEDANKAVRGKVRLTDLVPNYAQTLNGPLEMIAAFSREGWSFVDKESKNGNRRAAGDACVLGTGGGLLANRQQDAETESAIRKLYLKDYKARWKQFVAAYTLVPYRGIDDAIRRLELLSGPKTPLLGLMGFVSSNTYFPEEQQPQGLKEAATKVGEKVGLGSLFKKGDQVSEKVEKVLNPSDPEDSPTQITRAFQPVHWVVPPGSDAWINEKNTAYVNALAELRQGLLAIARSSGPLPDPAIHQPALQTFEKARESVRQLAIGFKPLGSEGVDEEVRELLDAPIIATRGFIRDNPEKAKAGKLNGDLAALCAKMRGVLQKYPFSPTSTLDADLSEVSALFAPATGAIWKFQQESLGEYVIKQGREWVQKPEVQQPKIAQEVLTFLNRAQQISDAFYPAGATQPNLRYTLRPQGGMDLEKTPLLLIFDGKRVEFTKESRIQKEFVWPAPAGAQAGADGRYNLPGGAGFGARQGLWGVFHVFGGAEPRQLGVKAVEWRYTRGAGGERQEINPPVRLEFVEFPGGVDLLNPRFFEGLRCPARATQ